MVEGAPRAPRRARLKLRERIAFLEARRDDLQAAGNRLLLRARDAEAACVLASRAVRAMREDITTIGEAVRLRVSEQEARIAELEADLARRGAAGLLARPEPSKFRAECCGELAEGPCEDCPFVPIVAVGMPHIEGDEP